MLPGRVRAHGFDMKSGSAFFVVRVATASMSMVGTIGFLTRYHDRKVVGCDRPHCRMRLAAMKGDT